MGRRDGGHAERKAIPSCPCCSPSDSMERWKPHKRGWVVASTCSRTWTTFTRRRALREWMGHMLPWRRSCGPMHESICTMGRRKCGTEGAEPSGMEVLTQVARAVKPGAVVWRGDPLLPPVQQGLKVLGVPIGHGAFVEHFLENKSTEQQILFQRIPWVNGPQAAYLLHLMCGATRANFWLRTLRPEDTESYAIRHDENVWSCLRQILGTPNASTAAHTLSTLSLSAGGLGLASAVRVRPAAHWSSWADSLRMVRQRHPAIAERMVVGLEVDDPVACFRSVRQCKQAVLDAGLEIPHWQVLPDSLFPANSQSTQGQMATAGHCEAGTEVRA